MVEKQPANDGSNRPPQGEAARRARTAPVSPLARFFSSKSTRFATLALLALLSAATIYRSLLTLDSPLLEQKDLLQDYLMGKAVLEGTQPYLPVVDLARSLGAELDDGAALFPHPCPHPPTVLPLVTVLALPSFKGAAAGWLALSLAALLLGIATVLRTQRESDASPELPKLDWIVVAALASWPVSYDLYFGQFGCILFALLALAFRFEQRQRMFASGVALGAALCLKIYGWPLLIRAALLRRYSVLFGAALMVAAADLAAVGLAGAAEVVRYYTEVAPYSAGYYAASERNLSLWTIGQRLFLGLHPGVTRNVVIAPPLWHAPSLAAALSVLLPLAVLLFACIRLRNVAGTSLAYAAFLTLSAVLNPVAWESYLVPLLLPIMLLYPLLIGRGTPSRRSILFAICCFVLLFAPALRDLLVNGRSEVGAVEGLLTTIPLLSVLALLSLAATATQQQAETLSSRSP